MKNTGSLLGLVRESVTRDVLLRVDGPFALPGISALPSVFRCTKLTRHELFLSQQPSLLIPLTDSDDKVDSTLQDMVGFAQKRTLDASLETHGCCSHCILMYDLSGVWM